MTGCVGCACVTSLVVVAEGDGGRWGWVDTGHSWQCGGCGGMGWACLVLSCLCPCRVAGDIHVERYIQENLFVGKVASEVVCEVVGNVFDVQRLPLVQWVWHCCETAAAILFDAHLFKPQLKH